MSLSKSIAPSYFSYEQARVWSHIVKQTTDCTKIQIILDQIYTHEIKNVAKQKHWCKQNQTAGCRNYLYENSVIEGLQIFDILSIKNANNIIILQNKMFFSIELHLCTCILRVHHLGTGLDKDNI